MNTPIGAKKKPSTPPRTNSDSPSSDKPDDDFDGDPDQPVVAVDAGAPLETFDGPVPPANLKIALTGDTDTTAEGRRVLELVKAEGAQALLSAGDLDYGNGRAANWENQINQVLGADFPVFPCRGNHDGSWTKAGEYQDRLTKRWDRMKTAGDLVYSGMPGMKSSATWKGITIVAVAPSNGVPQQESAAYIKSAYATDKSLWRIAMWHENMPPFRGNAGCGSGGDLVGWGVFEESRKAGAIVLNGHNHVFGRTKLLSCMGGPCSQTPDPQCNGSTLPIVASDDATAPLALSSGEAGKSFVVLSGMGGHSNGRINRTGAWWGRQSGNKCDAGAGGACVPSSYGALFCTFNPGGTDPRKATCQFIDIDKKVVDSFTMITHIGSAQSPQPPQPPMGPAQ